MANCHQKNWLLYHPLCPLVEKLALFKWAELVKGAFQVAVPSFQALSFALLRATCLKPLYLWSLGACHISNLCHLRWGGYGGFAANSRSYVHSIWEMPCHPHQIYQKTSLYVHKLDNLLKYPKDSPIAQMAWILYLIICISLICPGKMRLCCFLGHTHF